MTEQSAKIGSKQRNPSADLAMGKAQCVRLPQLNVSTVRLLPTLMAAAAALLVLKSIGILSGEGYILTAQPAFAQEVTPEQNEAIPAETLSAQTSGNNVETLADAQADDDNNPLTQRPTEATPIGIDTERTLLERLAQRRQRLDDLESQLQTRLAVLEAAEKRLDARAQELKKLEEQVKNLVSERENIEKKRFEALVSMYETMKPKDAARIFDRLQLDVLKSLVKEMNPRKMADILAKMSSERAQAITLALAMGDEQHTAQAQPQDLSGLPQIIGN